MRSLAFGILMVIAAVVYFRAPSRPPTKAISISKEAQNITLPVNRTLPAKWSAGTGKPDRDETAEMLLEMKRAGELPDSVRFVSGTGRFTAAFIELFEIQGTELTQLEQAVSVARERLARLQCAHAKVASHGATGVEFTIETFPADGGRLYDEMIAECAAILSGSRGKAFAALCGPQFEQAFGGAMGCDRMVGTISSFNGQTKGWTVMISNSGDTGPTLDKMYRFDSLAAMQRELGPLADLIHLQR